MSPAQQSGNLSTSIETKVENGYLMINGKQDKKKSVGGGESIFESTFHRTFPAPSNVDSSKMQTQTENDKIVLKFPKLKT
ncbi:MAG: Hsp20/alpha crystallin family protein [Bdellovibrionales bacterium]